MNQLMTIQKAKAQCIKIRLQLLEVGSVKMQKTKQVIQLVHKQSYTKNYDGTRQITTSGNR